MDVERAANAGASVSIVRVQCHAPSGTRPVGAAAQETACTRPCSSTTTAGPLGLAAAGAMPMHRSRLVPMWSARMRKLRSDPGWVIVSASMTVNRLP